MEEIFQNLPVPDDATGKMEPVTNYLTVAKSSEAEQPTHKMERKVLVNKLGQKRTVWVRKMIDTKDAEQPYG